MFTPNRGFSESGNLTVYFNLPPIAPCCHGNQKPKVKNLHYGKWTFQGSTTGSL